MYEIDTFATNMPMLLSYLKASFARKKARRFFREYPYEIERFDLSQEGPIEFANWKNPLVKNHLVSQSMVNFFRKFIPQGSMAIDIGGNIGDTTVPMALAAGKAGIVLGFDPNPHVFKILEINAGLNKDKTNIIPLPFAITEEDGEFYYGSSEASFSNGGISTEKDNRHGSFTLQQKIQGINLENYLQKHYASWVNKLSFIKIDTEGYDKEIIKSISPLLEKYKPVVAAECFGELTKEERKELFDSLADKGYELYYFGDFEENTPTEKITSAEGMNKWEHFNLYAKPI